MSVSIPYSSIPEAVLATASKYPNHVCLVDPPAVSTEVLTYSDLAQRVCSIAQGLLDQDVSQGERIGLVSVGRSWWPITDLAIMSIGAWTVPIYPSLPPNQIGFIVRHAELTGIFVENEAQYEKLLEANREAALPIRFVVILDARSSTSLLHRRRLSPWPVYAFPDWIQLRVDEQAQQARRKQIKRTDPATIVYTSGTTGVPKGVVLTHENILANCAGVRERLVLHEEDVHLSYLPLSHIFERTCGQFIPLVSGSAIYYAENIDTIVEDFARVRPTTFTTVPRLLEKVHERVEAQMRQTGGAKLRIYERALRAGAKARVEGQPVSNFVLRLYDRLVFEKIRAVMGGRLRFVVSGGAPLATHVAKFTMALGIALYEGYGMTETSPVVAFNSPDAPRFGTVGRILGNVQVRVADDGELQVKGASITPGYYRNQAANDAAFTEDGWLKTGDIAEVSDDGYLRITDRKKHLIVLSTGKKVTPAPIENDLIQSPLIDQVCLVGQGRKFVAVIVVPNRSALVHHGTQSAEDALTARLEQEVARLTAKYARYEQPKRVIVAHEPFTVENDLLTPTLKVKANKVCERYASEIEGIYQTTLPEKANRTAGGYSPTSGSPVSHS